MNPGGSGKLGARVIGGFTWTLISAGGRLVMQLVVLAILARLISPDEFGVITAAMVVVNFAGVFSQMGVGPALVQGSDVSRRRLATATLLSLATGAAFALGTFLSAPLLAALLTLPALETVLRPLAAIFLIRGAGVVSESLIQRDLGFRSLATIELVSYLLGFGFVGTALAIAGHGVWALVAATLGQAAVRTLLLLHRVPLRIGASDVRTAADLLRFGGGYSLARVGNFLALQGDNLVVARVLGAEALGIYSRAYQLMGMPASLLGQAVDLVMFPVLSTLRTDADLVARNYRRGLELLALLIAPTGAVFVLLAPEIVLLVLGERWGSAVLPFQVFSACILFRIGDRYNASLLRALGVVYSRGVAQLFYALMVFLGAGVGAQWGLPGVAGGVAVAIAANFVISTTQACGRLRLEAGAVGAALRPGILLGATTLLVVWLPVHGVRSMDAGALATLLVGGLSVAGSFALLALLRPRPLVGTELIPFIRRLLSRPAGARSRDGSTSDTETAERPTPPV